MTDATAISPTLDCDREGLSSRVSMRAACGAAVLASGLVAGAFMLDARLNRVVDTAPAPLAEAPAAPPPLVATAPSEATEAPAPGPAEASGLAGLPEPGAARLVAANPYGALTTPSFDTGSGPLAFSQALPPAGAFARLEPVEPPAPGPAVAVTDHPVPVETAAAPPEAASAPSEVASAPAAAAATTAAAVPAAVAEQVASAAPGPTDVPVPAPVLREPEPVVPMPAPRPPELRARPDAPLPRLARSAAPARLAAGPAEPADNRTFLEKLFGMPQRPNGAALAYASPDDGLPLKGQRGLFGGLPGYDRYTAVYDISAHTVYLPDGTRLEAHSGLGNRLDDPRFVHEPNRGPTPPHVYDLTLRESLFHGVQALRLNPVGGGGVFGRTGLLAHTFMLGPNGDSNGCVSFRNYSAFLQAYLNGQIRRLAVVPKLG